MATYQLLCHLRRSRPYSLLSTLSVATLTSRPRLSDLIRPVTLSTKSSPSPPSLPHPLHPPARFRKAVVEQFHWRTFSTRSVDDSDLDDVGVDPVAVSERTTVLEFASKANDHLAPNGTSVQDSILPVRVVVSVFDGYHELTGLPWWLVIVSSTLALRLVLFPILVFQLHKLKKIAQFFPELPPPFPPPLSGKSYIKQFSLFRKERKAAGCPSYLWHLASFTVQVPCFILWMISVRRMSLDNHPGFDCGGTMWFQDLTAYSHGLSGIIFPLLIAGLHYTNVQISFRSSSVGKANGLFSLLAKYYKRYLDLLTVPIFFLGYCIPQGSLVYWVTNSSLTIIQQLSLRHPAVQAKLGLLDKSTVTSEGSDGSKLVLSGVSNVQRQIPAKDLSPKELLSVSVLYLSRGEKERAIPLLQLALKKDPEYVRALITMGQTLLQKGLNAEAAEYLERATSKLGTQPATDEAVDLLILASQWAGVAYIRQGKNGAGLVHFERLGNLEEPEDPASKAHYFDGLVLFASALFNEGRKTEAAKYLRLAAAYNPAYNNYLEQCENDNEFVADLASSRREF